MPNWVMNYVTVNNRDAIIKCVTREKDGNVRYDFEKIVPMPDDIYRGDLGQEEMQEYGKKNWFDWSVENWGTKWNASDYVRVGRCEFQFTTAWSTPEPVMKALSEKYHCKVEVEYADECIGQNCGRYIYEDGELVDEYLPETNKEAHNLSNKIWGYDD